MDSYETTNHEGRLSQYKTKGLSAENLRQKRRDDEVQIRKQKRESLLENRRKIANIPAEPTGIIEKQVLDNLRSEDFHKERTSLIHILHGVRSGSFTVNDLAKNCLLSLMSDICLNRQESIVFVQEIFSILAGDTTSLKEERSCLIHLCSIIGNNDDNVVVLPDAIQAVSLFVGLSYAFRNIALDNMIVPLLLNSYENDDQVLRRRVMWLVSQLFHKLNAFSPAVEEMEPLLDLVVEGLQNSDAVIQCDAMRAVAVMTEWEDFLSNIEEYHLVPLMIQSTRNCNGIVRDNFLRVVNFIAQTSTFTHQMIESGVLINLKSMISVKHLAKHVCFVLSNIAADGEAAIEALINSGLLVDIAKTLETADYQTRKEAAYTICHCCSSSNKSHLQAVIDSGFLKSCTDLLTVMDTTLVRKVLDALFELLKYGDLRFTPNHSNPIAFNLECLGAKTKLEFLTESQDMGIHVKAYSLLERFFDDEELVEYNSCAAEMQSQQRTEVDHTIEKVVAEICAKQS